ncbi:MAG: metallophosphoesterase family protein [Actinobacteria bacterium]|nr:metallophosphoesterase family protein [Actinomycetota bacterium]
MARTVRVGLIADSHVGEFLEELPAWVHRVCAECDLILHAGDLSRMEVIEELEQHAPVIAVRGDHDVGCDALPTSCVVTVQGWRIGLIHGGRGFARDSATVMNQITLGRGDWHRALHRRLLERLGGVDVCVYGHWHVPMIEQAGSTLVVSPGAICPWGSLEGGREPRPGIPGVADRAVRRFRRQMGPDVLEPTMAVLDVGRRGPRARHIRAMSAQST